jgi:hypothetical protein
MSSNQTAVLKASEFLRQNLIGVLIGLNIRTVEKHTLSALTNSLVEVGGKRFSKAFTTLWATDPQRGKSNWDWAMETFDELGRRHQNFQEQVRGAQVTALEGPSYRKTAMSIGSAPVAFMDLMSAVPTAIAAYEKAIEEGRSVGDAIYAGNTAVRFAHGSTAITSRPEIMRGTVVGPWMTSLYGYMNRMLNNHYRIGWQAKEAMDAASKGETEEATKYLKPIAAGIFAYVIMFAVYEELATPSSKKDDSWEMGIAKAGLKAVAAPWPGVRDLANGLIEGDPSLGLSSTEAKFLTEPFKDMSKREFGFQKSSAGKTIKHVNNMLGLATGLTNGEIGNLAEYLYDLYTGKARPQNTKDWYRGLTKGQTRPKENRPDLFERGLRVIEGGR